jgi:iron complex outermembrane receptor protein
MAEDVGISSTLSLNGKVPALAVTEQANQTLTFLRGVGTTASAPNSEDSVATYVDGVYIYSTYAANFPLAGLDHIEVLKGPQGTLFGRNATGGVIQIVTKDPSQTPSADVSFGYANYNTISGSFYGTTGLTDNFSANLAVDYRKQYDGWGRNLLTGADTYWNDYVTARAKFKFSPSEKTDFMLSLSFIRDNTSGYNLTVRQGVAGIDGVVRDLPPYDTANNSGSSNGDRALTASLQIDHDFGFGHLTSLSAGRKVDTQLFVDIDATPAPFFDVPGSKAHVKHFQEELRLSSAPESSRIDWNVGGFFFLARAGLAPNPYQGTAVNPTDPLAQINNFASQDTISSSLFAQASLKLTDSTKLTAGVRQTWETIKLTENYVDLPDGTRLITYPNRETTYSPLTDRLALDQKISEDVLAYVSYSRGSKSGGYNIIGGGDAPPYLPETLDAAEIGVKTQLFDHRLRFNTGAYYYWYKNLQVSEFLNAAAVTLNAATARLNGIDGDFEALLTDNLILSGAFALADGKYLKYPNAIANPPSPGPSVIFDASGKRTIYTPRFSGNLGLHYKIQTAVGSFVPDVNANYSDPLFILPTNRLSFPVYAVVNASLSYTPRNESSSVRLWAKNLFDDRYPGSLQETQVGDLETWAPPRTFGITVESKFR